MTATASPLPAKEANLASKIGSWFAKPDTGSSTATEVVSVVFGGLLFVAIGLALNWKPGFVVLAAAGFTAATWLSRSLARALICAIGALGVVAAGMTVVSSIDSGLASSLGIGWSAMFFAWWLAAVALSICLRMGGPEREFGVGPLVGVALSIAISLVIARKIDFGSNLLFYLVAFEDNAAWVGLSTQLQANAGSIGGSFIGSTLGPLMPLIIGTLGSAQRSGTPWVNSVFASYSLAIILSPLVAASVVRGMAKRPWPVTVIFTLIVFAWAFGLPATLFLSAGHLSATWAFLGVLLLISFWAFDLDGIWILPAGLAIALFVGAAWFPIAPLAGVVAIVIAALSVRRSGRRTRAIVLGITVLAIVALLIQLHRSGVGIGTDATGLVNSIKGLYASQGGTAELDGLLVAAALGGITLLAFEAKRLGQAGTRLSTILLLILAFLIAIYAGGYLLQVPGSYGSKKLTYVLGYASLIVLIGALARANINGRSLAAVIAVLAFTSLTYGGGGQLLQRAWPGDGSKPTWLKPVEAAVARQDPKRPRPVVCFGPDAMTTYLCTRWAGALTAAGDGAYLGYRLDVVHNGSKNWKSILRGLKEDGTLRDSDVVFLTQPVDGTPWGWTLARNGGRLFGPYGNRLPTPEPDANRIW